LNDSMSRITSGNEISSINVIGPKSYPLVNFEYAIVSKNQTNTSLALNIRSFLDWVIDPRFGSSGYFLDPYYLVALPPTVAELSLNSINAIGT